jgi:hypothetical protein
MARESREPPKPLRPTLVFPQQHYDGWAPNYMFYVANGHNSIGRFYETFGIFMSFLEQWREGKNFTQRSRR